MRLIDADDLISDMQDKCCGECDLCIYSRYENACYFCGLIEEAPTVDIQTAVWELYERYQPRLATNVYKFGIELKELLCRYGGGRQ